MERRTPRGLLWGALGVFLTFGTTGCYDGLAGAGASGDDGADAGDGADSGADDGGSDPLCLEGGVGVSPLLRLTRSQYNHVVHDLLGTTTTPADAFPADEQIGAFYSNAIAPVTDLNVEQFMAVAEDLAAEAVTDLPGIVGCDPGASSQAACAGEFIASFGLKALRRPLTDVEQADLMGVYESGDDYAGGIQLVIQTLLQSPYFLYHVEIGGPPEGGAEVAPLTSFEIASRLSFFLWDSMPDDALFEAAAAGELETRDQVRDQALRMLDDPRAADALASFHTQWLGVDQIELVEKDPAMFPQWDPAMARAMRDETAAFADHVIRRGDGSLETLLTAPFSVFDETIAALYDVTLPADHVPGDPVDLDPSRRAGLLTHPSLLAQNAHNDQASPVHRGVIIRQNILCQPLPPPPEDVDNVPPDPDPNATTRERFAEHTADPACAGCHVLIDPVGFGYSHYDAIGAYVETENGLDIDASGQLNGTDVDGPYVGAVEMAQKLAQSDQVRECVAQQWFSFALGRIQSDADKCSTDRVYEDFQASNFSVRELILSMVITDAFRMRSLAAPEGE